MDSFLLRAVCAFGFFIGGLNFIGLGLIENGADTPDNFVWTWILELYHLEWDFIRLVASVVALWMLSGITQSIYKSVKNRKSKASAEIAKTPIVPVTSEPGLAENRPAPSPATVNPPIITPTTTPELKVKKPTAEELKRRAIEQLFGKG